MNTKDTSDIQRILETRGIQTIPPEDRNSQKLNLAFIGGLDSSKRIKFLRESLDILVAKGFPFHLNVVGAGPDEHFLHDLLEPGYVTLHGFDGGSKVASTLLESDAILSPGRIGLLAVDALASSKPILTTRWPHHAPEFEYLVEGESLFISEDSPAAYAQLVEKFSRMDGVTSEPWNYPRLETMVSNFAQGIKLMIAEHAG